MISKKTFLIVLAILLLSPLLIKTPLLLSGKIVTGTVVDFYSKSTASSRYSGIYYYSIIEFDIDYYKYRIYGPQNVMYELNEKVAVICDTSNYRNSEVFSLTSLYLGLHSVIPLILSIFWLATYYGLNVNSKADSRKKFKKAR